VEITGIAGPDGGSASKPVGLVFISVGNQDTIDVFEHHFYGDRETIQHQAVMMAFDLLAKKIDDNI
jgi:nicotinamide mononucleotide (NMN) deamidase PncC